MQERFYLTLVAQEDRLTFLASYLEAIASSVAAGPREGGRITAIGLATILPACTAFTVLSVLVGGLVLAVTTGLTLTDTFNGTHRPDRLDLVFRQIAAGCGYGRYFFLRAH